jgi:glycosyltransferase involved in cell wall biosynthesis
VLAGLRDDVPALLACMDVFILTSLWEGLPRVIVQAMAAGVPVVANGVDGVREIIRNGANGFMVDPGDTASMADRIISLLECPELRASVTRQAHATVRQEFSLWSMIERIEEIYGELLREKKLI